MDINTGIRILWDGTYIFSGKIDQHIVDISVLKKKNTIYISKYSVENQVEDDTAFDSWNYEVLK